jgi:inner membrane protein
MPFLEDSQEHGTHQITRHRAIAFPRKPSSRHHPVQDRKLVQCLSVATTWTHAFFALAAGKSAVRRKAPLRLWILTAVCATIPDIDVFWRGLVAGHGGMWSHRGITHSLLAAVLFGLLAALVGSQWRPVAKEGSAELHPPNPTRAFLVLWLAFALAAASHLVLDMLSSGYRGVALLAPFTDQRYSFPWQPIWNIPHWAEEMFPSLLARGARRTWLIRATLDELVVVWLPMAALVLVTRLARFRRKEPAPVKVVK